MSEALILNQLKEYIGKEIGLSERCFPDILVGDMPHIYVYHVTNPSEAIIAKRRGYAQIVNHASPSFARSELYGDYLHVEDLITEYEGQKLLSESRAGQVLDRIREEAQKLGLPFGTVDELHRELSEIKRTIIPTGLHMFGQRLEGQQLADYLTLVSRYDRGAVKPLHRLIAESEGLDYEEALETPAALERIEVRAAEIISRMLQGDLANPLGKAYKGQFAKFTDYILGWLTPSSRVMSFLPLWEPSMGAMSCPTLPVTP